MLRNIRSILASIREKDEAARKQADFYAPMLREVEAAAGTAPKPKKHRKPKAEKPAKTGKAARQTKQRAKPVKAEVSASEAIVRLLAGCKMGLPGSEIVQSVATTCGYKANSLRTTLSNMKKKGAIVQGEDGVYNHAENVG